MPDKYYYVTWEEQKNRSCYSYYTLVCGSSVKDLKEIVFDEQNTRRGFNKPHMFHTRVTKAIPDDLDKRTPGRLYSKEMLGRLYDKGGTT